MTSEGDLPVVKILTTIFEQVDHDDDGVDDDNDVLQDVVTSFVNIFWGFKFRVQVVKSSLTIAQSTKAANVSNFQCVQLVFTFTFSLFHFHFFTVTFSLSQLRRARRPPTCRRRSTATLSTTSMHSTTWRP